MFFASAKIRTKIDNIDNKDDKSGVPFCFGGRHTVLDVPRL